MTVTICKNEAVDVSDVIRRSPVRNDPNAQAVMSAYILSSMEVWVGYYEDEVACVCGLIPPTLLSDTAYLWLLHTDLVEEHKFLFIRHSQIWLREILERYPLITGHVIPGNDSAIKWLRWLGAKLGEPSGGRIPFIITSNSNG